MEDASRAITGNVIFAIYRVPNIETAAVKSIKDVHYRPVAVRLVVTGTVIYF